MQELEKTSPAQSLHDCRCKDGSWTATLNTMPPGKPHLKVTGACTCPTGGFKASLKKAEPQGINPTILLLQLSTEAPTGIVNQMVTDYPVTFEDHNSPMYTEVTILPCDVTIPVNVVS